MIKMSRYEFKENLTDAMADKDLFEDDETIEEFLDLNYDEDSSITEWDYMNFRCFVSDIAAEGFWEACRLNDFHTPDNPDGLSYY